MRLTTVIPALLLVALSGCADAEPQTAERPWAAATPTPVGEVAPRPAPAAVDEPPLAPAVSVPDLFQCLVQGEVLVQGPYPREVTAGVTAETLDVSFTDTVEVEHPSPNTATVYLFPDAAAATAHAEAARAERGGDSAVADAHASAVLVADRALTPSGTEQALLACLPDADPVTALEPPAPGTASLGSLLECGRTTGLVARGEHTFVDESEDRLGVVVYYTDDGFGGVTERGRVFVFADPETAAAQEAAVVDGEPQRHALRGNTVTEFPGAVDPADPDDAAVLACLPA